MIQPIFMEAAKVMYIMKTNGYLEIIVYCAALFSSDNIEFGCPFVYLGRKDSSLIFIINPFHP